jgi:hypothetical protein
MNKLHYLTIVFVLFFLSLPEILVRLEKLSFKIDASQKNPIKNLCFVIKNWGSRTGAAKLSINGNVQAERKNFRQGVFIDTDGTFTKVIWVGMSATAPQDFEITKD